jgi:hypothetical protein
MPLEDKALPTVILDIPDIAKFSPPTGHSAFMPAPNEPSFYQQLVLQFVPVLAGGFIGVFSTLLTAVGAFMLHRRTEHSEAKKLERTQLEHLLTLAYDTYDWAIYYRSSLCTGRHPQEIRSPISQIRVIASLYLPAFHPAVAEFSAAVADYEQWALGFAQTHTPGTHVPENDSDFATHLQAVSNALDKIEDQVALCFQKKGISMR